MNYTVLSFVLMSLPVPNEITRVEDFLDRLSRLPSYESSAASDWNRWKRHGLDIKYFNDQPSVTADYVALTRVSVDTFDTAFVAFQLKLWDNDDSAWRLTERPSHDLGSQKAARHIKLSWLPDLRAKFSTLYWLMFDDPSQKGSSPWVHREGALILQPAPRPLSGYSIHSVSIPPISKLRSLRRIQWHVRYLQESGKVGDRS